MLSSGNKHLLLDSNCANKVEVESNSNLLKEHMENNLSMLASNCIPHTIDIAITFVPNFLLDSLKKNH